MAKITISRCETRNAGWLRMRGAGEDGTHFQRYLEFKRRNHISNISDSWVECFIKFASIVEISSIENRRTIKKLLGRETSLHLKTLSKAFAFFVLEKPILFSACLVLGFKAPLFEEKFFWNYFFFFCDDGWKR